MTPAVWVLVLALMFDARDVLAEVTSDWRAREPDERVAPVRVREPNVHTSEAVIPVVTFEASCLPMVPADVRVVVATFHTSAARVPKVVRDRVPFAQTLSGIFEAREVDAVRTVASVWLLMVAIAVVN